MINMKRVKKEYRAHLRHLPVDSCSRKWYCAGNASTHDYEVTGDPPRYTGGCASEDCPECKEAA